MEQPRAQSTLVLFCLAVVALLLAQVLGHGPMLEADREISLYFASHRHAWLTRGMLLVSELHRTGVLLVATALLAIWRGWRRDWFSVRALLVVPVGMLCNLGLKNLVQRARPVHEDPLVQLATYSFPSSHAVASTVFYGMLCALVFTHTRSPLVRGCAAAVAVAMVLLVTFSRVYLGAHFPSDVIAGVAFGTACVLLFLRIAALLAGVPSAAQPTD
jgi:membrane-associated phospholipid phosphatase